MTVLEKCTNPVIEKVRKYLQQKGTDEEIVATINETDNPVEQNLLETETPMHRVQASYDMGWQVHSLGNKYGSPTGHGLLLGAITKKVMDSVIFNKKCAKCTKNETRTGNNNAIKMHNCVKKFEGSSKLMEAAGLLLMLNQMPSEKNVSVCTIISDDDSNARAKAQHAGNRGQLTPNTEEPRCLADPSHIKRVFACAIYALASAPMKVSRVTKRLAGHLKYCYGAAVNQNCHLTTE